MNHMLEVSISGSLYALVRVTSSDADVDIVDV